MKMKGYAMLGIGKTGWIEKDVPDCQAFGSVPLYVRRPHRLGRSDR